MVRGSNPSMDKSFSLKSLDRLCGPPSLISNGHRCRVPGEERVGCDVYYTPQTSAKVFQAPKHKEGRTIRIIALGVLNLDCRRGVWLASVTGRSPRKEKALVTRELVVGWMLWKKEKFVSLRETDHYF